MSGQAPPASNSPGLVSESEYELASERRHRKNLATSAGLDTNSCPRRSQSTRRAADRPAEYGGNP